MLYEVITKLAQQLPLHDRNRISKTAWSAYARETGSGRQRDGRCALPGGRITSYNVCYTKSLRLDSCNLGGAEIDDLHRAVGIDHDVLRFQVLVDHFLAVEGVQAGGDLLHDAADLFQRRLRIVVHPLAQGLSLDILGHIVP